MVMLSLLNMSVFALMMKKKSLGTEWCRDFFVDCSGIVVVMGVITFLTPL